jgi:cobalt/nickel transport protein
MIPLYAHFQMVLPSTNIVLDQKQATIGLELMFCHPFEQTWMNMARPHMFGVMISGEKREDLLAGIFEKKIDGFSAWTAAYKVNQPGDHVFFVEPAPYWEPAEGKFIVHHTKTVVNGFGMQEGWDAEIGLETEIIPLTRPYGLYAGNVFCGLVKVNGKPAPLAEVEVEYYNSENKYTAPSEPYITQVIMSDASGVFTYAMPKPGWWGFAALSEREAKLLNKQDNKEYPVEIGALIWVYADEMK